MNKALVVLSSIAGFRSMRGGVFVLSLLALCGLSEAADDVVWTNLTGVTVNGTTLTATASGWGNAGAISQQTLEQGGFLEFVASETTTARVCGLSRRGSGPTYAEIDFGVLFYLGRAWVSERSSAQYDMGPFVSGDRFRIELGFGVVRYRKNGDVRWTSALPFGVPPYPMLAAAALYDTGATITNVRIGEPSWIHDVGVSVAGGTLTKTGATAGWNAGAGTAKAIEFGDGYLEFTATETNTGRVLGLSHSNSGSDPADIDFGISLRADGTVTALENNTPQGSAGNYASGDRFRVEVSGGSVKYLQNGSLFYTSTQTPRYPLRGDAALFDPAATLTDVVVVPLLWANVLDVSAAANTLTKTGSPGWGSGASSTAGLASGDGYAEFTAWETNTNRLCGLSSQNASHGLADVDFGIALTGTGTVQVYEGGSVVGTYGSYAVGDRFRVEVAAGVVKYRKNSVVFYTSATAPAYPLYVNTSLNETGATLADVALGNLAWNNELAVLLFGNTLQGTAFSWGSSGATVATPLASGDGGVEFTATEQGTFRMLGLSRTNTSHTYSDLDFAIYLYNANTAEVWESGAQRPASITTFAPGDQFVVAVEGGTVKYRKNGALFYISTVAPQYPLWPRAAFYTLGATFAQVRTAGLDPESRVALPVLTPPSGSYTTAPQTIGISSLTAGATFRCTRDGSDPDGSPTAEDCNGSITLSHTTPVKVRGFKPGLRPSDLASGTYTFTFGTLSPPSFDHDSGTYMTSVSVGITAPPAEEIWYTLGTPPPPDPTCSSTSSTLYTGPVLVSVSSTLKAIACQIDYAPSSVTSAAYTIVVEAPTFTPDAGTYPAGQPITVATPTPGATITYTLNGGDPTVTDATVPPSGILIAGNYTLKAKAWKTGCNPSPIKTATYSVTGSFGPMAVTGGSGYSLAIVGDGTVWAWSAPASTSTPHRMEALTGITKIAAGGQHALALGNGGRIWAWGDNTYGQIGDGTIGGNHNVPVQLANPTNVVAIAAGGSHSLAVTATGQVWAWGYNLNGQIGDNTTMTRPAPVQLTGLPTIVSVAAGWLHSVALKADGTVLAWGNNTYGQVGDATDVERHTPQPVEGLTSITAVAACSSGDHSLALRSDGAVWGWGSNAVGQLGNGATYNPYIPVEAVGVGGITGIAAGAVHSVVVKSDGTVWAWGYQGNGQVGDGSTAGVRPLPVRLAAPTGVVAVGAGSLQSLAVTGDTSVWGWGANSNYEVGDGTQVTRRAPIRVTEPGFGLKVATPIFGAPSGTYYQDGPVTLTCNTPMATISFTTNGSDPLEGGPNQVPCSGGPAQLDHSLTLRARAFKTGSGLAPSNIDMNVYTMQVAPPTLTPAGGTFTVPQTVTPQSTTSGVTFYCTTDGSEPTMGPPSILCSPSITLSTTTGLHVKGFRTGWTPSLTGGGYYSFNYGPSPPAPGISPNPGTYQQGSVTVTLSTIAGATIKYTTNGDPPPSGSTYTAPFVLSQTARVRAVATHPDYPNPSPETTGVYTLQVPDPALSPGGGSYPIGQSVTFTESLSGATVRYTVNGVDPTEMDAPIASGSTISLLGNLTVKARAFKAGLAPSAVVSATYTVTGSLATGTLAGGLGHSLARRPDGTAWAWGQDASGQLGDNSTGVSTVPVQVKNTPGTGYLVNMVTVSGGRDHSLFLTNDGSAWASGSNGQGQLGNTSAADPQRTPIQVSGISSVSAVSAGHYHSLAVTGGAVYAWGRNATGQLGIGNTTPQSTPVPVVGGLSGVIAVAAGEDHSLALKSDGSVWAWGSNAYGQIGSTLATNPQTTPIQVMGVGGIDTLSGVVAIAVGYRHSIALLNTGTVVAWGENIGGQLGDNSYTQRNVPVAVVGLSNVLSIAGGWGHSLASRADGTAWAWGNNGTGQLGNGDIYGSSQPRPVLVSNLNRVLRVAAGAFHSLAVDEDGTVWAWGFNNDGEIGDGTRFARLSPVRVSEPGLDWKVGTPYFSLLASTYYAVQSVTFYSDTPGPGVTIYYTTDGSEPTPSSPNHVNPGDTVANLVDHTLLLRARGYKPGMQPSNLAAAAYELVIPPPATDVVQGTYSVPFTVQLSDVISGVTIRYTTDGTPPTTLYTAPISIDKTTYLQAKAFKPGWTDSVAGTAYYTMKVANPGLSPGGGSYTSAQTVTLTSVTPGAIIHYSTTGVEPTESSPSVSSGGTVLIDKSGTMVVKAWKGAPSTGWSLSDPVVASYTISNGTVATPSFNPPPGTYDSPQSVGIGCTTPGATIRYTLDGSEPTWTSKIYYGPVLIDWTKTLKAKGFAPDWVPSTSAGGLYTLPSNTTAPPEFNPAAGFYTTQQIITLTSTTPSATIHYTLNAADPTEADPSVPSGGTVTVDHLTPLKAKAFSPTLPPSTVRRGDYQITGGVAVGDAHVLVVKYDRSVWAWGLNTSGQLGNNTTTSSDIPVQVRGGEQGGTYLQDIVAIAAPTSADSGHSLALSAGGRVFGWGSNYWGQLGDGTSQNGRLTPVQVRDPQDPSTFLTGVVAMATGFTHSVALKADGTVVAWGGNLYGQLGDGTNTDRLTPVPVMGIGPANPAVAVGAGWSFSMALMRDGTVKSWGYNGFGELGDGTTLSHNAPVSVMALTGVTALSVAHSHTVALKTDGAPSGVAWAWGNNDRGEIGDGTNTTRLAPVRGLTDVLTISAGDGSTLFLKNDVAGQRMIWGTGFHLGLYLNGGVGSLYSVEPIRLKSGYFYALSAGNHIGNHINAALRFDTSLLIWEAVTPPRNDGLVLGNQVGDWANADPDNDGLTTQAELAIGTDPWNPDTNGDGILDGPEVAMGLNPLDPDMDKDGIDNWTERRNGTDPFNPDTDGDGFWDGPGADGTHVPDCFPLDRTRHVCPSGSPQPPHITLTEPTNYTIFSIQPPP